MPGVNYLGEPTDVVDTTELELVLCASGADDNYR